MHNSMNRFGRALPQQQRPLQHPPPERLSSRWKFSAQDCVTLGLLIVIFLRALHHDNDDNKTYLYHNEDNFVETLRIMDASSSAINSSDASWGKDGVFYKPTEEEKGIMRMLIAKNRRARERLERPDANERRKRRRQRQQQLAQRASILSLDDDAAISDIADRAEGVTRNVTLTSKLMEKLVTLLARPWKPWVGEDDSEDPHGWCLLDNQTPNGPAPQHLRGKGLFFARTFKTGSTTAASVTVQMAHRIARRRIQEHQQQQQQQQQQQLDKNATKVSLNTACQFKYQHTWSQRGGTRECREPFALWSIVRDPTQRALSAFNYYRVGHANETAEPANLKRFFTRAKNHQFVQLLANRHSPSAGGGSPTKPLLTADQTENYDWVHQKLKRHILQHSPFHFIAVQERWAESLAVLQILWNLREGDVMTATGSASIKAVGDWTHQWESEESCFFIPKKPAIDDLQDWITHRFMPNNLDFLLHRIVNQSLDLTIEQLGQARVHEVMQKQGRLQALIQRECRGKVTYPCSVTGQWQPKHVQDCFKNDIWCGYPCLNDVVDRYEAGEFDSTIEVSISSKSLVLE